MADKIILNSWLVLILLLHLNIKAKKLMRKRESINTLIISHFAILKTEVNLRSKLNLQDINVHAEQFYKILLNKIFNYGLENINIVDQNAAVIDLGDDKKRIAIQVTSNNSKTKIVETVEAFNEKELFNKYDELKILIIKDKTKRIGIIDSENFSFDMNKDVIDVNYILNAILNINELDRLEEIEKWLSNELVQKYYQSKEKSKSNEVITFISLIDFLSNEENHKVYQSEDAPDPEHKIENRFKEYAPYLKSMYVDLYIDYAYALSLTEDNVELSSVKIRKIGIYLKDISNRYLNSSRNNPEDALENLCDYFKSLFIADNLPFDEMAIKFYLLHQLIKCNVFPN